MCRNPIGTPRTLIQPAFSEVDSCTCLHISSRFDH